MAEHRFSSILLIKYVKMTFFRYKRNKFEIDPEDIFLVSYPKSGNTWVRFILANLFNSDIEINFANIHMHSIDIHQKNTYSSHIKNQFPRIIKSHSVYDPRYGKVVYIVRDGRDVYISYYNYLKNNLPPDMDFDDFLNKGPFPYGIWSDHVQSWLKKKSQNMLLLKYEDLKKNPIEEIKKILFFMNLTFSEKEIQNAISKSTFSNMKRLEASIGRGTHKRGPKVFMRKGLVGEWKGYYTPKSIAIFKKMNNKSLLHLNYETKYDWDKHSNSFFKFGIHT